MRVQKFLYDSIAFELACHREEIHDVCRKTLEECYSLFNQARAIQNVDIAPQA